MLARLLLHSWTWRMAWRDSRRSRHRLLLCAASIVLGIAALTAIASFGRQMDEAIRVQSKALLGADLEVDARDPFTAGQDAFLESLGGEQAREVAFASMVYFVNSEGTRLAQVRALAGEFPFYGEFQTIPATAVADFRSGRGALVEQNLMDQFGAKAGDLIKVGDFTLPIAGTLTSVPGETVALGTLAPRVYVPMDRLEGSGLLGQGSLVRYKAYFKFDPALDVERMVDESRPRFRELQLRFDTVSERQRDLGRGLDHLLRFLNLIGFVALLLGGVGVASGIHVHMKQKLATVATLRCLGSSVAQAFAIYFAQAIALGLAGAVAGAASGVAAQFFLQSAVSDFMPLQLPLTVSWAALGYGMATGLLICLLFALLPLLPIRRIPPLAALRSAFSHEAVAAKDPLIWLIYLAIGGGLAAFGVSQSRDWEDGLGYAVGIALAFGLLAGVAWGIARVTRMLAPRSWPFVWRQGFSNLYRPNNRTVLLMQSLGMGTFLVLTMYLVHANLLGALAPYEERQEGNTVLFDIQSDQKEGVLELLREQNLPVLLDAPMISMRLHSINGEPVQEILSDRSRRVRRWALRREYRSTYRSELAPTEKLVAGVWHERAESLDAPVPVSVERDLAGDLNVGLGDELVFNVQGLLVPTRIASLREVEWRRLSPNFFVVFPRGAIEAAPAVHALLTQINSSEQSARLQREVVQRYPNVSAVDLRLVLQTVDNILAKISAVVRFMALFTLGTGLLVLGGTIVSGRYQRLQESILLRTLGATRRQVLEILTAEYLFLGVLAAMTGILLALTASWALSRFVFDISAAFHALPVLITLVTVAGITVIAGLLGNRKILNRPPLEVLRVEN